MKKLTLFYCLLLISCFTSYAQYNIEWVNSAQAAIGFSHGAENALDSEGNIYTVGYFNGIVDFDPSEDGVYGLNANTSYTAEVFIQKLSPNGDFLWVKYISGISDETPLDIAIDSNDNVYVGCILNGPIIFNPVSENIVITEWTYEKHLVKLNSSGGFVWAKNYPTNFSLNDIVIDSDDNILLCGSFFGSEYFAPGDDESLVSSNGSNDIFLLKLDSDGNFLWVKTIGGSASDLTEFITTDSYGNIYIAGRFKDTVDFDFSDTSENFLVSSGGYDIFLQKLDNDGNFIWVEQFGALSDDFINAFTVDNEGENIFVSASLEDVDLSSGEIISSPSGFGDDYVLQLDDNGDLQWSYQISGVNVNPKSMTTDTDSNVYITGEFGENVILDNESGEQLNSGSNNRTLFILELNKEGEFTWAKRVLGKNINSTSITSNSQDSLYVTGSITRSADFDIDSNPGEFVIHIDEYAGDLHAFSLKLSSQEPIDNVSISENSIDELSVHPITGGIYLENVKNPVSVRIYNLQGSIVATKRFSSSQSWDLSHLPGGMYLYQLSNQSGKRERGKITIL